PVGAEQPTQRLRQRVELRHCVVQIGILDPDLDRIRAGRKTGIADPGFAQRAAHVIADLVKLLFLDVVGIDFEQQIRTTLQVEAKYQPALRPGRPSLDGSLREEIRNGAEAYHQRRQDDRERLPPREIHHRVTLPESANGRRAPHYPAETSSLVSPLAG